MVKFEDRHITQPVARNEFELGRLHWSDHSEDEISKAVVENARRLSSHHEMTPRQTRALSRFKYDGSFNIGQPWNYDDMKKFFDIFSDLFFGGLLSSCKLQLNEPQPDSDELCDQTVLGEELDPRRKREYLRATVHIITNHDVDKGVFTTIQDSLDTLLHEQLHAILDLHTCDCDSGCEDKLEYEEKSHGVEWLAAALAIESAATPLLGWPVNLDRNACLADDIHFLGYRMPNEAVLRALDLDVGSILSTVEWHRVQSVKEANNQRERLPSKQNRCLRDTWTVDSWGEKGFQNDEWLLW